MTKDNQPAGHTAADFARELNGCEYGSEGPRDLWTRMKVAGFVAVFGASDDIMEFRGAIDDELSAYGGTKAFVTPKGLFVPCECECRYSNAARNEAAEIDALWGAPDEPAWTYETDIPHSTFEVMEDGEVYCRGIVFALSDALRRAQPEQSAQQEEG